MLFTVSTIVNVKKNRFHNYVLHFVCVGHSFKTINHFNIVNKKKILPISLTTKFIVLKNIVLLCSVPHGIGSNPGR